MNRRNFIISVPLAGVSIGTTGTLLYSCTDKSEETTSFKLISTIEKVKLAMLTMQRATWEQGVAMQALLESGDHELVILMAKDAVLRQSEDGRVAMLGEDHALTDAASPGEAILWAARETNDPVLMKGYEKLLHYMLKIAPRNEEGIIYHFTNTPQFWCDCNYMLPPFLAVSGEYKEALKQIFGVKKYLWNPGKKLHSHMWHDEKKELNRAAFWGVGNGWSAAGFARVITSLPDSMKEDKKELIAYTTDLIDGCIPYIRADGFFHNIIDDTDSFIETNLGQQLAYTIFRGIKEGWLDKKYFDYAEKMRSASLSKVDELGMVRGVCGSPEFDHPGTASEGQAFFILMETAYKQLTC
jgi:unsaturated rhamnogalacturonyl hydrolase